MAATPGSGTLSFSNSRENEPPADSAGENEEHEKVKPVAAALRMVAATLGVRELLFFAVTMRRFIRRGKNVLPLHLGASGVCGDFLREEGFNRADLRIKLIGLVPEIGGFFAGLGGDGARIEKDRCFLL